MVTDAVSGALLERSGRAVIVAHHDTDGGLMPNSVYYTHRARLEADDSIERFCRAQQRAYNWLRTHEAVEAKELLAREWPGIDTGHLVEIVDDLRRRGIWEDIRIVREGYDEWLRIQVEDGLVSTDAPYERVVDTRPAQAAVDAVGVAS
jgi:NitT/TauT family transport system substrate-binding protein